ncbi:universal stress protein [Sciscionella sediminilitoris]|uniref:universal stress protein n=1 Tax=Sciscionella sediminilitoris TaxID=1445613 RepID=UPI0007C6F5D6|nr:universal stress protein [Sciscionella sp. SE31]
MRESAENAGSPACGAVVVGVDGSPASNLALRWAIREVTGRGVGLHLVHATGLPVGGQNYWRPLDLVAQACRAGRVLLRAAEQFVEKESGGAGITVTSGLVSEYPGEALVALSGFARTVVLGATGYGGFPGILAGSTTEAVATHAHCPVVVVRGRGTAGSLPEEGPVVLGVDEWHATDRAIAAAFDEAAWLDAPLVAVHAWTVAEYGAYPAGTGTESMITERRRFLATRLARWQEKYPDVRVEQVVAHNRTRRQLLEWSGRARLLVVGSHGRGAFSGLVLGSVSRAMVYHAQSPVLVVSKDSAR